MVWHLEMGLETGASCILRRLLFLKGRVHMLRWALLSFGIQKAQRFATTCYASVKRQGSYLWKCGCF